MRPCGGRRVRGEPVTQRLGRTRAREVEVSFEHRFPGRGGEHCAAPAGGRGFCAREGGFGPLAQAGRRTIEGLADERGDDPQTQLGVGLGWGVERPGDRGAEIVELGVEAEEPRGLVGSFQAGAGGFREAGVVLGVAAAMFLGLTGVVEAFECVLAQGLEETKARAGVGSVVELDHRLGGQVVEAVSDVPRPELVVSCHRGGGICVEAPGEDADTIEDDPLAFVEERIGPFDGGPQRLMTLDSATAPAGEEPEPFVEQPRDLARTHARDARRRQLDRQWDRVEPSTDLHDLLRVRPVELQTRPGRRSAIHEQLHRLTRRDRLQVRLRRGRNVERRHPQQTLSRHAERLAARCEHSHPRRGTQHRLGERRRLVQKVLAVVEHDQRLLPREIVAHTLRQRSPRP